MAETPYPYPYSAFGASPAKSTDRLKKEILESAITTALERIDTDSATSTCDVVFKDILSSANKIILDGDGTQTPNTTPGAGTIVKDHDGVPLVQLVQAIKQEPTGDATKALFIKGVQFTVVASETMPNDLSFATEEIELQGVTVDVGGSFAGDKMKLEVVNTAPTPDVILALLGDDVFVTSDGKFGHIAPGTKTIPATIVLRATYVATADVGTRTITLHYRLWK